MNEEDELIVRRDVLDSLKTKYTASPNETVWEQAVRYGQLAYEAYCISLYGEKIKYWIELTEQEKHAWIEVGAQIEQLTLTEQN